MSHAHEPKPALIDYPTTYVFKVMGKHEDSFVEHIKAKFARLIEKDIEPGDVTLNHKGKFVSVTVTVFLQSEEQRKAIYADIHSDKRIVYYL